MKTEIKKTEAEESDFGQFYYIEEDHISQGSDYEESIEIQNIPLQQEEASQDCEEQEEERPSTSISSDGEAFSAHPLAGFVVRIIKNFWSSSDSLSRS